MEKTEKSIRTKELVILLVIFLLFFLFRYALSFVCTKASEARENEMMELKMSTMMDIVSDVNTRRTAADTSISENVSAGISMMTNLLKEFVTEDGYEGPRTFSDGIVAELHGERVSFPQGYRDLEKQVTREMIEKSIESGAMMSCVATADEELRHAIADRGAQEYTTDTGAESYFLSFGEIAEDVIYVDILSRSEYNAYLDRCTRIVEEALKEADGSFGGITLVLREKNGDIECVEQCGSDTAFDALSSQNLLQDMIRGKTPMVSLDGQDYSCACSDVAGDRNEEGKLTIIQMVPKISLQEESAPRVRLVRLMMVIILVTIEVYTISVQRAMAEKELSEKLRNRYSPKNMRRRMVRTGILSVVVTFALVVLVEAVGMMYTELRNGRDVLNLFSEQLERNTEDEKKQIEMEEERWIVYYCGKLAPLLSEYPALSTPEKLRETCEVLGADMIMLFDSEGRQTLCSQDYTGFRLDDEDYPELYDFRRLLYGVPSIIHETALDPITGLERQQIGVTMPAADRASMHGALIMTLLPERIMRFYDDESFHLLSSASGTICFAADSTDGIIVYSSKPGMTRKLVSECGLSKDTLRDGTMDFATIAGSDYLMITSRDGKSVYFYAAGTDTVFGRIILVGAIISLIFAVVLTVLLIVLLRGYNEETYREWEVLRAKERERVKQRYAQRGEKPGHAEDVEGKTAILRKLRALIGWNQKSAGEKAVFVFRIGMIVFILCALETLNGKALPNESYGTMLGFFMKGSWMRGLNLFSVCSILLLIAITFLTYFVCSLMMKLTGGIVSERGETIIRLLYSAIRYILAMAIFYFGLEYLGFSIGTIIASLSILSLALSLGAQDLIKDILAGLAIVFDGSFHIGDVVEIGGTAGVVQEIGVRATKLTVEGNNTLYINNSEISRVLNKSREPSILNLELRISAKESLLKLEELLKRELPEIGSRNSKIKKGPILLGVTGLSGTMYTPLLKLAIEVMIDQKDEGAVTTYLYREIRLMCEREGVELL